MTLKSLEDFLSIEAKQNFTLNFRPNFLTQNAELKFPEEIKF